MGKFKTQFQQSMEMVQQGIKHAMIVAVDVEDGSGASSVVGFLEVGMLPCPCPTDEDESASSTSSVDASTDTSVESTELVDSVAQSSQPPTVSIWDEAAAANSGTGTGTGTGRGRAGQDVPFLGNVAVLQVSDT